MSEPAPTRLTRPAAAALVAATAAFVAAVAFDVPAWLRGPAPYPPEWQWPLRPDSTSGHFFPALAVAASLLGLLALSGLPEVLRRPRRAATLLLAAGILLGWGFSLGLLELEPAGAFRALVMRTRSHSSTSYDSVAASPEARDVRAFLRNYPRLLPGFRTSAKHAATHPPGPVLFYRALIGLCDASPRLTARLVALLGQDDHAGHGPRPVPTPSERAGALLGALLLGLLGAATAWPIASLAQSLGLSPLGAVRVGLLWAFVPGPAVMAAHFDPALALPVTGAAALLAAALADRRPGHASGRAFAAGLCGGLAVFLSYGSAAFLPIGGLAVLAALGSSAGVSRAARSVALAALGMAAVVGATLILGYDPVTSARIALAIHREVYTEPRHYGLWLFFNPLDLAVFLSVPLAMVVVARTAASARHLRTETGADRFRLAVAGGLILLILAGVTRGEVGRIWIPLMPLCLAAAFDGRSAGEAPGPVVLLAGLMAVCAVTIRVFWLV